MKPFITYCKLYIYDNIEEYCGQKVYPCDLGITLTDGPNCDGTLTYSVYDAIEYLKEWRHEASDYFEYAKDFGTLRNPFENPEAYMVCMVIEGVRALIDQAFREIDGVDLYEKVELTDDLIEQICEKVNENETNKLF